jgi:two-component system chemotaxis response regulator CheY
LQTFFSVRLELTYDHSMVSADGRVVLIVEDEQPIREVMAEVLHDRGFRALRAANGAEALQVLDTVRPDVVVLDLLMPVMHGWAFMESYVEKTDGHPIPIVVVSVNPALPRSFNRLGVRQVVAKPFELEVLIDAVEQAAATA